MFQRVWKFLVVAVLAMCVLPIIASAAAPREEAFEFERPYGNYYRYSLNFGGLGQCKISTANTDYIYYINGPVESSGDWKMWSDVSGYQKSPSGLPTGRIPYGVFNSGSPRVCIGLSEMKYYGQPQAYASILYVWKRK